MKRFFLISLFAFSTVVCFAQEPKALQVPEVVTSAFKTAFPAATGIKWEQKKESYKSGFKVGKVDHDVWFSGEGKVIKHRVEMKKEDLPEPVANTIKKDFSTYKIDDCEKTEELGAVSYKVTLKSEAGKKNVHFDKAGKVIDKKADK